MPNISPGWWLYAAGATAITIEAISEEPKLGLLVMGFFFIVAAAVWGRNSNDT